MLLASHSLQRAARTVERDDDAFPHSFLFRQGTQCCAGVRGLIAESTLQPLPASLKNCAIDVEAQWYAARVSITYTFVVEEVDAVKTFVALDVPKPSSQGRVDGIGGEQGHRGWHLMQFKAQKDGGAFMSLVPTGVQHPYHIDGIGGTKGACQTVVECEEAFSLFTADIPWVLHTGSVVVLRVMYGVELDIVGHDAVQLIVPRHLFAPSALCLPDHEAAAAADGAGWKNRFKLPSTNNVKEYCTLTVWGELAQPLAGAPTVSELQGSTCKQLAEPNQFEIRWEGRIDAPPADDVVFRAQLAATPHPLSACVATENAEHIEDTDRYALCVAMHPRPQQGRELPPANVEVIFAVESLPTTSNLTWQSYVVEAVATAVAGLPASCYVNAVQYGHTPGQRWLYGESRPLAFNSRIGSVRAASASTESPSAQIQEFLKKSFHQEEEAAVGDAGGPRVYEAFSSILHRIPVRGYAQVVVWITAGGWHTQWQSVSTMQAGKYRSENIYNKRTSPSAVVELLSQHRYRTRVAAVTLGPYSYDSLGRLAATASHGKHLHCNDPEQLLGRLPVALSALLIPTLSRVNIGIEYEGGDDAAPSETEVRPPTARGVPPVRITTLGPASCVGFSSANPSARSGHASARSGTRSGHASARSVSGSGRLPSLTKAGSGSARSADGSVPSTASSHRGSTGAIDDLFLKHKSLPLLPFNRRSTFYAFVDASVKKPFRISVTGMVGAEFHEWMLYVDVTGTKVMGGGSSSNSHSATLYKQGTGRRGDASTLSITHVVAAYTAVDNIVMGTPHTSFCAEEEAEFIRLSNAFHVNTPYSVHELVGDRETLAAREYHDHRAGVVGSGLLCAPYVDPRAYFIPPPPQIVCHPSLTSRNLHQRELLRGKAHAAQESHFFNLFRRGEVAAAASTVPTCQQLQDGILLDRLALGHGGSVPKRATNADVARAMIQGAVYVAIQDAASAVERGDADVNLQATSRCIQSILRRQRLDGLWTYEESSASTTMRGASSPHLDQEDPAHESAATLSYHKHKSSDDARYQTVTRAILSLVHQDSTHAALHTASSPASGSSSVEGEGKMDSRGKGAHPSHFLRDALTEVNRRFPTLFTLTGTAPAAQHHHGSSPEHQQQQHQQEDIFMTAMVLATLAKYNSSSSGAHSSSNVTTSFDDGGLDRCALARPKGDKALVAAVSAYVGETEAAATCANLKVLMSSLFL